MLINTVCTSPEAARMLINTVSEAPELGQMVVFARSTSPESGRMVVIAGCVLLAAHLEAKGACWRGSGGGERAPRGMNLEWHHPGVLRPGASPGILWIH